MVTIHGTNLLSLRNTQPIRHTKTGTLHHQNTGPLAARKDHRFPFSCSR